jgi:hypothetical protein
MFVKNLNYLLLIYLLLFKVKAWQTSKHFWNHNLIQGWFLFKRKI